MFNARTGRISILDGPNKLLFIGCRQRVLTFVNPCLCIGSLGMSQCQEEKGMRLSFDPVLVFLSEWPFEYE